MMRRQIPSPSDLKIALSTVRQYLQVTPLLESSRINDNIGYRLFVKAESLQQTGSFKIRGAINCISKLDRASLANGVITYSSGNHAQGVAASSQILNVKATVLMPRDAPEIKIRRTREYGASIIFYDRHRDNRDELIEKNIAQTGATFIHPYDQIDVILGQSTVGQEAIQQALELGATIDNALVCCGGGGLMAGVAMAFHHFSPRTKLYSVEPDAYSETSRSLVAGSRLANTKTGDTLCDALMAPAGEVTFDINSRLLSAGLSVSDFDVAYAMRVAFEEFKLVVEPGGAVALAAALSNLVPSSGRTTMVVISGGNVDSSTYTNMIRPQ